MSPSPNRPEALSGRLLCAWLIALASTLGALFVGEIMGQIPCNLCWYQRIFMFPIAVILAVALYRSDMHGQVYALVLAGGGWLVAAFHNLLYFDVIPQGIQPCGAGPSCSSTDMNLFAVIPLPILALVAFTALVGLLFTRTTKDAK